MSHNSGGGYNGFNSGFALIVVLFILLIIVGASLVGGVGTGPVSPGYTYGYTSPYYC